MSLGLPVVGEDMVERTVRASMLGEGFGPRLPRRAVEDYPGTAQGSRSKSRKGPREPASEAHYVKLPGWASKASSRP